MAEPAESRRPLMLLRALLAFICLPLVVAGVIPLLILGGDLRPGRTADAGGALLAAGLFLLIWCVRDFYVSGRGTLAPWDPPRRLVVVGLYRMVRNPMYISVLAVVAGWALAFGSPSRGIYLIVLAVGFHLRVLLHEEPWLGGSLEPTGRRMREKCGDGCPACPPGTIAETPDPGLLSRISRFRPQPMGCGNCLSTQTPMKAPAALLIALCLAVSLRAQATTEYTPEQLDQMLAPIALYPDPLIALILPASTDPSDIALAAQYLAANGDPSGIDAQTWDPSVKGLAHYPDVLKWMNDNLDWTRALGAAFAMQPADVMKSVQQLRAKAKASGTLVDTPQQQVDVEGDDIRIVPAQDDMIYVPQYDPDVVYGDAPEGYAGPFITFGIGFPVGAWLGFECDWDDFGIWTGPWHRGWAYTRDWRNPQFGGARWHPDARRGHALVRNFYRPGGSLPNPRPLAGERGAVRGPAEAYHAPAAYRAPAPAPESRPNYRGYGGAVAPTPSTPAPRGALYGGYSRGTDTRAESTRGQKSRSAPVRRSAPASRSAPSREAPSSGGRDKR